MSSRSSLVFSRVALIGAGLIGASTAHAIRATHPSVTILGVDESPDVAREAVAIGAVDRATSLLEAISGADLVVVATPVRAMAGVFQAIGPAMAPHALVTDTGSTKAQVLRWADEILPPHVQFVGGHPMAGKTVTGPAAADASLFRGAIWCLVPGRSASQEGIDALRGLVESFGAVPFFVDPDEHDGIVAAISHLPYFMSIAFLEHLAGEGGFRDMAYLAAGGFAYASHLTDSDPRMFADVAATNRDAILDRIDRYVHALQNLRTAIASDDPALRERLERVRAVHQSWVNGRSGASQASPVALPSGASVLRDALLGGRRRPADPPR